MMSCSVVDVLLPQSRPLLEIPLELPHDPDMLPPLQIYALAMGICMFQLSDRDVVLRSE